jgi:uncharacterized Zn finger protein (UPF0148 family)
MAKKKRGMPTKYCIDPKCGASMHARSTSCPVCGKKQPSKAEQQGEVKAQPKPETRVPVAAAKPAAAAPAAPSKAAAGGLNDAVSFVRQVGGLEHAKKLLADIEEIKNL